MKKAELLKEALGIVEKRGLAYGKPENNFKRIAGLWELYVNQRESHTNVFISITETDVAALMVLMKVARLMEKPDHLDSWLDIAGYAACGAEVSRAGENTEQTLDEWLGTGEPPPPDPFKLDTNQPFSQADVDARFEAAKKTLVDKFSVHGDPGFASIVRDVELHGLGAYRRVEDGSVERIPLGEMRDPTDHSLQVNVQHQKRELKIGDPVVSKKPYESTWVGTVKFLQACSGLVQVEWRSVGKPTEHPWNTLHRPEELEIAAVPS